MSVFFIIQYIYITVDNIFVENGLLSADSSNDELIVVWLSHISS